MDSSDENSLPHMLSPNHEDNYTNDNDAWPSPMTNSVTEDDRSASLRMMETSSISSPYPQFEGEYTLNTGMGSNPRHRRKPSSCETIVTNSSGGSNGLTPSNRSQRHLQPRVSSRQSPSPPCHHRTYHSYDSAGSRLSHPESEFPAGNLRPPPSPTPSILKRESVYCLFNAQILCLKLS